MCIYIPCFAFLIFFIYYKGAGDNVLEVDTMNMAVRSTLDGAMKEKYCGTPVAVTQTHMLYLERSTVLAILENQHAVTTVGAVDALVQKINSILTTQSISTLGFDWKDGQFICHVDYSNATGSNFRVEFDGDGNIFNVYSWK